MSSIGWIDFSSDHRDKVRTVIDLLSNKNGVIDELGIGVVRDGFSNRMFPGITTIQTRAKYFILTALLLREYQDVELKKRKPRTLDAFLGKRELDCRIQLIENSDNTDNSQIGIIGSNFGINRKRDVQRRASSIYWNGLRQYGFIKPIHLSLIEFGKQLSQANGHQEMILNSALEGEVDQHMEIGILSPDVDTDTYWEQLSIHLTTDEAGFLKEQICANQRDSLIGRILVNEEATKQVLSLADPNFEGLPQLPFFKKLPADLKLTILHAKSFWDMLEGAHIRYNCLLQDQSGTPEMHTQFLEEWQEWKDQLVFPTNWNTDFVWELAKEFGGRVHPVTRNFIESWIAECRSGKPNDTRCDDIVTQQEKFNKGSRARLRVDNDIAINNRIGFTKQDYRFSPARIIIEDIVTGLNGGAQDA